MKFIKKFNTHTEYEEYINDLDPRPNLPNLSLCENNECVHLNRIPDPRVIAKFNVTDISEPTYILYNNSVALNVVLNSISEIEIDGVVQPSVTNTYQFDTTGVHTVKYTLADPTTLPSIKSSYNYYGIFYKCEELIDVIFPNTVTSISAGTFNYCSHLINVVIPNSVTTIYEQSFANSGITTLVLPNSITRLADLAFYSSNLTKLTLHNNITSIGTYIFQNCYDFTSFGPVGSGASIEWPFLLITNYAFSNCIGLTSVIIPDYVTVIGVGAFLYCSNLTSIIIPSNVTTISNSAFYSTGLLSVTIENEIPPSIGSSNVFTNSSTIIYVPAASVDTYKTTTGWSTYKNIIQAIPNS